jgi:hypothetical protein
MPILDWIYHLSYVTTASLLQVTTARIYLSKYFDLFIGLFAAKLIWDVFVLHGLFLMILWPQVLNGVLMPRVTTLIYRVCMVTRVHLSDQKLGTFWFLRNSNQNQIAKSIERFSPHCYSHHMTFLRKVGFNGDSSKSKTFCIIPVIFAMGLASIYITSLGITDTMLLQVHIISRSWELLRWDSIKHCYNSLELQTPFLASILLQFLRNCNSGF